MRHTYILTAILVCAGAVTSTAQSYRALVEDGNEAYSEKDYSNAESYYKDGIREKPERIEGHFNLGNAAYRRNDIQAALDAYKNAATNAESKPEIAQTLYNVGNAYLKAAESSAGQAQQMQGGNDMRMQGYRQAIEAYKQSLKLNPSDADARYNLVYAMKKLEELQKQDKNQNQNQDEQKQKDKQKDKKEDQNQQDKNKQQDEQKKEQQDKNQQQQQNQKDQQQDKAQKNQQEKSRPEEQKMSKEQAEQILKALERDEKELQKKVRAKRGARTSVEKDW